MQQPDDILLQRRPPLHNDRRALRGLAAMHRILKGRRQLMWQRGHRAKPDDELEQLHTALLRVSLAVQKAPRGLQKDAHHRGVLQREGIK